MPRPPKVALSARAARRARLVYVETSVAGIRRVRSGRGYRYLGRGGQPIRAKAVLRRIESLAIPPAWEEVWICPSSRGHVQAMGTDARGRRQYIYHPDWRSVRDEAKFETLVEFASRLPKIRKAVAQHLRQRGMTRNKVLAAVVRLLERTLIRVGNDEYARQNGSYGLTTMHNRHARVSRNKVVFDFRGKSGIRHQIQLADSQLARIVQQCQRLPGQQLFQYLDDAGKVRDVTSTDVNNYLKQITGADFTAKDFRTWAGTVLAAKRLAKAESASSQAGNRRTINAALREVAQRLGNTLAVCRKSYVHPEIVECYLRSSLPKTLGTGRSLERLVLALLSRRTRAAA